MNYRFEPTGEVRPPMAGEWFLRECEWDSVLTVRFEKAIFDYASSAAPIYRRVPHEDTSCEVAFARMIYERRSAFVFEWNEMMNRFCKGERSPELTAALVQLTERMKGSP